ncbi:MAG: iron ABC transporter permease [Treponema sp.]|nr:iron ABC transporter permease [Treponema sp.]
MKFDSSRNSKSLLCAWIIVAVFFCVCVIFPLVCVLTSAKIADYRTVFTQPVWHSAMGNTFVQCICSSLLSVIVGYVFAYAVVKAEIPGKKFFSLVPIIHLITPPFVGGLAFILLFGKQGFITHTILGLDVSLYGFWGLLVAQVLSFFPMAFLICSQVLRGINTNIEQSARSLGAGEFRIFLTVTLPLSWPGILSSFLFIAVSVLSDFGNPLIVGGRFRVLAVEIYTQLTGWLNIGTSAVLGIVLVIPSVILFLLQNRISKKLEVKTATVGGKSYGIVQTNRVPVLTKIILFSFVLIFSLFIIAQVIAIIAGSFQQLWGINTKLTLKHILAISNYGKELKNSVIFAMFSAVLSTVMATISSYLVHRTDVPLRKTLDVLAQLPSAIPGTLHGLSISIAANLLHFNNSTILIILAMTIAFMPFAYRIISNSFGQLGPNLDQSARSLGANQLISLLTVLVPLARGGIFSGFVYDFIRGVGTLSAVIFLVSFKTPLASIQLINLAEQGAWGRAAALAMILTLITFVILGIGLILGKIINIRAGNKNVISFY